MKTTNVEYTENIGMRANISLPKPRYLFTDEDEEEDFPVLKANPPKPRFVLMPEHNYIKDILTTMFNEQSEHLYSKFTEGYMKVSCIKHCFLYESNLFVVIFNSIDRL